jgi:molybdopterin-biosynthesis enzyme MoeA-like protein
VQICYNLIDGGDIDGRLYSMITDVADCIPKIAKELSGHLKTTLPAEKAHDKYTMFGTAESDLGDTVRAVSVSENHLAVIEVVKDVVAGEKDIERQKKRADIVSEEVRKASTALLTAINCIGAESQTAGIHEQLKSIEDSVQRLRKWLTSHVDDKS